MAEPKRFDVNKIENFLKNSADKTRTLSYWNAAVEHGKTVKEIDENLASNVDNKQIADLLLRRTDATNRRDRLIKAVENTIKVKYQPQIPEMFSAANKAMPSRLVELQHQCSSIGRINILMSALQDENQILNYLHLDEKKRAFDKLMVSNEKLREDSIANGNDANEEDYAAACQELLQKRSDIKTKIEALLKSGDEGAILRSLEDAEQRLADARVNSAADKFSKNGTSSQKETQPDDEQKGHDDGHIVDDRRTQLANTQKQNLPSLGPNFASIAKVDYYIRSSLPKLKLAEFSGDPLEWPEWSQLFQATVHAANIDDSVKMNHLKTMVTGKAKEAIAGLGYTAEMYNVAWNVLVRNFGKPQMVVNAQLKRIYSFPPMKPYDGAALIKFARLVSSCVNVLTQFNYVCDLNPEGVLGSATRKLTLDMKTKWLTYVKQMNLYQPGLAVFSEWLNDIADVQDELLLSSNPNADRAKSSYKKKAKGPTFATSTTNTASDNSKYQRECALKDGKHPIWKCEKFKKMNVEERGQKAKELKLCFKFLSDAHQMRNCSGRLCDVSGCGKPHHRLLHRPYKIVEQKQNVENVEEVSNLSSMKSSGVLPVIPVTIGSGSKTPKTFALCDSGASLSFVDESLMKTQNLTGQPVDLNVAGIHGTSDISSKRLRVRIGDQDGKVKEDIMAYSHHHVNAGNRTYDLKKVKETYPHMSVLKDSIINLKDVKVILGQDCYHLHRAIDYRKCGNAKPWVVRTKLGWMLSGPLPQQETAKLATESLVPAEVDPLADQVKTWWSMESYASNCSASGRSKEDDKALEMLKAITKFDGERYEVGLLWKNAKPHLPNNYSSAVSQLKSLERRLEKDESLKQRYKETIDKDVQKGLVRILDEAEFESTKTDLQWYVPHLPVLNPNKPDKVRRVCDAASKFEAFH